jgi:hypothetical protein
MRTHYEPQLVKRPRPARPTREINPHSLHVLGGPALFDLVLDCGNDNPVTVVKIPADLAHILRARLDTKLGTP